MYSKMIDLLNLQSVSFKEFRLFPIITFGYRPGLIKQHNMCPITPTNKVGNWRKVREHERDNNFMLSELH